MKTRKWAGLAVGAVFLCFTAMVLMGQVVLPPTQDLAISTNETISGSDTLLTAPVQSLGAQLIVFSISATTGIDSSIVPQVSQDGIHYFYPSQERASLGPAGVDKAINWVYLSGDSLNRGPVTGVLHYVPLQVFAGTVAGPLRFPYRWARLKIYGKVGKTITGLRVIGQPIDSPADLTTSGIYSQGW